MNLEYHPSMYPREVLSLTLFLVVVWGLGLWGLWKVTK